MNPLIVGSVLDIGSKVIDRLFPDQNQKAAAQLELIKLQQEGEFKQIDTALELAKGQMDINKVEAGTDLFRGGWRPACGWICSFGLFYSFILRPIAPPLFAALTGKALELQPLDNDTLMSLLFGLLGLGAFRTVERIKGKA